MKRQWEAHALPDGIVVHRQTVLQIAEKDEEFYLQVSGAVMRGLSFLGNGDGGGHGGHKYNGLWLMGVDGGAADHSTNMRDVEINLTKSPDYSARCLGCG